MNIAIIVYILIANKKYHEYFNTLEFLPLNVFFPLSL